MAGREANHHGFSGRPGTFGTRPDGTSLLYREFYPGRQPEQHHVPLAGRVLKRYGDTEKAYEAYLQRAENCEPRLPEKSWTPSGKAP